MNLVCIKVSNSMTTKLFHSAFTLWNTFSWSQNCLLLKMGGSGSLYLPIQHQSRKLIFGVSEVENLTQILLPFTLYFRNLNKDWGWNVFHAVPTAWQLYKLQAGTDSHRCVATRGGKSTESLMTGDQGSAQASRPDFSTNRFWHPGSFHLWNDSLKWFDGPLQL